MSVDDKKLRKAVVDGVQEGRPEHQIIAALQRLNKAFSVADATAYYTQVILDIAKTVTDVDGNRSLNITIALVRYTYIYEQALDTGDYKTALSAQKEIDRLMKIDGNEPNQRMPGNRGKSPSVAIQINNTSDRPVRNISDLTDEELASLAGKGIEYQVNEPVKRLPKQILESEATRLIHAQELQEE